MLVSGQSFTVGHSFILLLLENVSAQDVSSALNRRSREILGFINYTAWLTWLKSMSRAPPSDKLGMNFLQLKKIMVRDLTI